MKVIKIAFAFVFLCALGNALPDIGHCSFTKYFCKTKRCTTVFYKDLQKDPSANCSVKHRTMVECIRKVANDCLQGLLSQNQVDALIGRSVNESFFCLKGSFYLPDSSSGVRLPCTSTYLQKAPLCGKNFHQKFVANWSDPSLCSEYAKAKKCARDLLASECTFNSKNCWELFKNLVFGDYNPFCANNRDPGATGNDKCYGFLPGPTQSPTRPPTTLLFLGKTILPHELFDARKRKNKSDI
ncbi:uncharacterized protein LOC144629184 isoform X2 [Oculina patagonica]